MTVSHFTALENDLSFISLFPHSASPAMHYCPAIAAIRNCIDCYNWGRALGQLIISHNSLFWVPRRLLYSTII